MSTSDFAIIIPLANESDTFLEFSAALQKVMPMLPPCTVYFVVDRASTDNTHELCVDFCKANPNFKTVFEANNKNVVDAYLRGYKEAYNCGHQFIIEMDGGLSHDPAQLPLFIAALNQGYDCVFGSRFIAGGSMQDAPLKRKLFSRGGTLVANVLLGTNLSDMTSGYQGFKRDLVKGFLDYSLKSTGHFYQTELRYLLRKRKNIEIPISYKTPSPSISQASLSNSLSTLVYYFLKRLSFKSPKL